MFGMHGTLLQDWKMVDGEHEKKNEKKQMINFVVNYDSRYVNVEDLSKYIS